MSTIQNKQLLQQIFAALAEGNSKPLIEAMDDHFCWIVAGTSKWSGKFNGKQAVLTKLFGALRARIDGNVKLSAHRFIADDDLVVVEARGHNTTKAGLAYNNSYCFVFRLAEGKLAEVTEYTDTELATTVLGDPAE